jgi:transcriptional regulator with XRE-family HTH domain
VTTGTTIRTLRTEAGLSQAGLAARLGVAANTVARWERGEMAPPPYVLEAVKAAVNAEAPGGHPGG